MNLIKFCGNFIIIYVDFKHLDPDPGDVSDIIRVSSGKKHFRGFRGNCNETISVFRGKKSTDLLKSYVYGQFVVSSIIQRI